MKEIVENLKPGQTYIDRPDLVCRAFKLKSDELLDDITYKNYFGKCTAYVYVIEFQKRGLPHMHVLLWLAEENRLTDNSVDNFISAELPSKTNSRLFDIISSKNTHSPCNGPDDYGRFCRVDPKVCEKDFPKKFVQVSSLKTIDGFPEYRRREDGNTFLIKRKLILNREEVKTQQGRIQDSLNDDANRTNKPPTNTATPPSANPTFSTKTNSPKASTSKQSAKTDAPKASTSKQSAKTDTPKASTSKQADNKTSSQRETRSKTGALSKLIKKLSVKDDNASEPTSSLNTQNVINEDEEDFEDPRDPDYVFGNDNDEDEEVDNYEVDSDEESRKKSRNPPRNDKMPPKFKETTNESSKKDAKVEYVMINGVKEKLIKPEFKEYDYEADNSWVVPANWPLSLKYNSHINVEHVADIRSVKYLFKYIHKGGDCADLIYTEDAGNVLNYDEIQNRIST